MAWKIDRDYINDGEDSKVGTESLGPDMQAPEFRFRFRLLDDDGNVYYGGVADENAAHDDDNVGGLYEANHWGMYDAGAVDLQVRVRDALRLHLTSDDYVEKYGLKPASWVSIYG